MNGSNTGSADTTYQPSPAYVINGQKKEIKDHPIYYIDSLCQSIEEYRTVWIRIVEWTNWISPNELATGSIVYSFKFFQEINSFGSFYNPEDCQHDLLYWILFLELFSILENQCFTPQTVISTPDHSGKPMFTSFLNHPFTITSFFIHITHSVVNYLHLCYILSLDQAVNQEIHLCK